MLRKDSIWLGLFGGLALPSLAFLVIHYLREHLPFLLKADILYIGCVALNLILVNLAYRIHNERTARGVISSTFICAFIFFYYKLH